MIFSAVSRTHLSAYRATTGNGPPVFTQSIKSIYILDFSGSAEKRGQNKETHTHVHIYTPVGEPSMALGISDWLCCYGAFP